MNWAGAPPIKAIVFMIAIVLVVVGVIVYAASAHQGASKTHYTQLPSPEVSTSRAVAVPTGSASVPSPSAPTPKPRTVSVGDAICEPSDYKLTVHAPVSTPGRLRYVLTASYRGDKGQKCLLLEYPTLTVDPKPGKKVRYLRPHGGVVEGYGQPLPTTLSHKADAQAYFQVETVADGCSRPKEHDVLRHIKMEGVPVVSRLSKWCLLHESAWSLDPNAAQNTAATGIDTCRPYDLDISNAVSVHSTAKLKRYRFTVVNTTEQNCVLNEFPHLTALWHEDRRELTPKPTSVGPPRDLPGGASATGYLEVPSRCVGPPLDEIKVETIPIHLPDKTTFSLPNCSIKEAYWTVIN